MSELQSYRTMVEFAHNDLWASISTVDDVAFSQRPTSTGNPINFTYFHVLRHWDRDINVRILARDPEQDTWHRGDFAAKSGYDPMGKGFNGMGTGYGYTAEDVDGVTATRTALMDYQRMLHKETLALLDTLDESDLTIERPSPSGSVLTTAGRLQHLITHTYIHVGDIEYIKGLLGTPNVDVPNIV